MKRIIFFLIFGLGLIFFAQTVNAQSCPVSDPSGAVVCPGDFRWCGGTCRIPPSPTPGANQSFSCTTCGLVCNSGFADCNASSGCETVILSGSCTVGGQPGIYSGPNCSRTCVVTPQYVSRQFVTEPGNAETGFINVAGNMRSGGDVYLNSGKAIQVFGTDGEPTLLNIGNWGNGISNIMVEDTLTGEGILEPNTAVSLNLFGELNIRTWGNIRPGGGKLTVNTICLGTSCRTTWPSGGLATSGTATAGYLSKFDGTAPNFTLTNSLILEETGKITINGALRATGCFGPVFVGTTPDIFNGDIDSDTLHGYRAAHDLCGNEYSDYPDSHMCSAAEIINSISCGTVSGTSAIFRETGTAWIANGAPALPTQTNDCNGWTYNTGDAFINGVAWEFSPNGGRGLAQTCNLQYKIACCL